MLLKIKLFLIFLLPLLFQFKVYSQAQKGMLMYQIENKQFKKTSFDKTGKIISYQYIKVGSITENNGVFSLEIKVKIYDNRGSLQKEETSKYNCKTKEGNIFMGVFPFINKPSKKIDINVLSKNTLYPPNITTSKSIDDFKIAATYKTGLLGISVKVDMDYKDRSIDKAKDGTFIITGVIITKINVAGIDVSNVIYKSEEKVDVSKGIVFQKFTENTGAYFIIKLISK